MNIMGELAVIFGVCLAAEGISALLPFSFPASVISMLLLLGLLLCGGVKERHIGQASRFLTENMAFFFLPPCIAILNHAGTLLSCLVPFLLVSVVTTPLVYLVTAKVIQGMMALPRRREARRG